MGLHPSACTSKRRTPSRAQLFTLDLLLALIPLTIVLGFSANIAGGVGAHVQDYVLGHAHQRAANDAADALAKTPGVPIDWSSTNPPTVSGLAYYDPTKDDTVPMLIDETKLVVLNATHVSQLLDNQYPYFNLTIRGLEDFPFNMSIYNGTKSNVTDLVVVERNLLAYLIRIVGDIHQIAHADKEFSERCCSTCTPNQYIYELAFNITADELPNFNYWLGYASDGGVNAEYTVRSTQVDCCTKCSNLGSPKQDLFSASFGNGARTWETRKISSDFTLVEGMNYVYIRATGNPNVNGGDFYVLKAPLVVPQSSITEYAALHEPQAVCMSLEIGR